MTDTAMNDSIGSREALRLGGRRGCGHRVRKITLRTRANTRGTGKKKGQPRTVGLG